MKLNAVETTRFVCDTRDRTRFSRGHEFESWRYLHHLIAVAHPHLEHAVSFRRAQIFNALEQPGVASCTYLRITEFSDPAGLDLAAKLLSHRLHAVADAEHGNAKLEHRAWCLVRSRLVRRQVAAG